MFVKLLRLTESKEDLFTECLAATLVESAELAGEFVTVLLGAGSVSNEGAHVDVATQKVYPGCCIDMVLSVNGEQQIGVEHKLWAPEGEEQLFRYCQLGLSRIAFITGYAARVAADVLAHPGYARPRNGRDHFLWSDFYDVIEQHAERPNSSPLVRGLLELFTHLGFTPPHPEIGDLLDPVEARRVQNRENFAKLWGPTRLGLAERGWSSVTPGSIAELYVRDGRARNISWAWIDPTWVPGVLRVRLTPKERTLPLELNA